MSQDWSMKFDEPTTLRQIHLPPGTCLVAQVFGPPSPLVGLEPRTTHLVATSAENFAVRGVDGHFIWGERGGSASHFWDSSSGLLPSDSALEVQAMIEGWELIDWLCATEFSGTPDGAIVGVSENYGRFLATVDTDHHFVTRLQVHDSGAGDFVDLLALKNYSIVPLREEWFEPNQLWPLP